MSRQIITPVLLKPGAPLSFPDPSSFDGQGLLAVGGDLSTERLMTAYRSGVFPWYSQGMPILWWCPDPRAILTTDTLHVSRSMQRQLSKAEFEVTHNRAFGRVMTGCAQNRRGGTWLLPEMQRAYATLHDEGHAHSVEVWQGEQLVGGLYGVQCGALFAAESMFHTVTNASKVALVHTVRELGARGIALFDVQFLTPHLERMGAHEVSRAAYLQRVQQLCTLRVSLDL